MNLSHQELLEFLELKYRQYNKPEFIETDPVSIPHRFKRKEDIEIAAFLTATISWGNRTSIVNDAEKLLGMMGVSPFDFLLHASEDDFAPFSGFYHRTFNGVDCMFFLRSIQNLYKSNQSLESLFPIDDDTGIKGAICSFRNTFLKTPHQVRSEKHLADPCKGASAKRLLMFLRWMVRKDENDVDFGLWKTIPSSKLMCPLDVHSGRVARKLGLLERKQNDWQAVAELTTTLASFDPHDPVKYDFALFGLGVFEGF